MKRTPGSIEVDRALKNLIREVRSAVKQINQQAGKLLARGDYDGAERLVSAGRSVKEYQAEIEALQRRWKELAKGTGGESGEKPVKIPVWKYYVPTLRILISLGGAGGRSDIEQAIASSHDDGDIRTLRSHPRWKSMVGKALRAMVKEGFLEHPNAKVWQITTAGKKACEAQQPAPKNPLS